MWDNVALNDILEQSRERNCAGEIKGNFRYLGGLIMSQNLLRREQKKPLPFGSRELEIPHAVPRRGPSWAKSGAGWGGLGCLGGR